MADEAKWYVVHTYSGYENKVATNLEKIVENRKLHDWIHEIRVPPKPSRKSRTTKSARSSGRYSPATCWSRW